MGKEPRKAKITLTDDQAESLRNSWNGEGGFQTLGPELAAQLTPENEIELDDKQVGIIVRHMSYASSGFRTRVRSIFKDHFIDLITKK